MFNCFIGSAVCFTDTSLVLEVEQSSSYIIASIIVVVILLDCCTRRQSFAGTGRTSFHCTTRTTEEDTSSRAKTTHDAHPVSIPRAMAGSADAATE